MSRPLLLLAALACAPACDPGCDAAFDLDPGTVEGTLDGVPWTAVSATWRTAETGLQIVSPPADGWRLTLVAQATDRGKDVTRKVNGGGLPVDVVLGSGADGGWALLNPDGGDTYTTDDDEGGGWLHLARKGGGSLYGCAGFTAIDGRRTKQAALSFRAEAAE